MATSTPRLGRAPPAPRAAGAADPTIAPYVRGGLGLARRALGSDADECSPVAAVPDSRVSTRPDPDTRGRRVSRSVRAVSRAVPERTARTRKEGRDDSAAEALIARGQTQGQTSFDSATPATL